MKIRMGFVSNSSSSSYVCDVCGMSEVSWERPSGFTYCVLGHGLCEECYEIKTEDIVNLPIDEILKKLEVDDEDVKEELEKAKNEDEKTGVILEIIDDYIGELPTTFCPVCRFEVIIERDLKRYLEITSNISSKEAFDEVKSLNKRRRKLYDGEYITYVCAKTSKNTTDYLKEIKEKFNNFEEFSKFLRE